MTDKTVIDEIRKRHFASAPRNAYLPEHNDRATLLAILAEVGVMPDKWASGEKFDNEDQIEARRDCSDELKAILNRTNQQGKT